jgi:type II secretory pathway component PulF
VTKNELAYLLATSRDAELRDGPRALKLAEQASAAMGGAHPAVLDTVAVAQAESGDLEAAARTLRRALDLARTQGQGEALQAVLRKHLATIESGQPVRE